jgi:hypothetical protein
LATPRRVGNKVNLGNKPLRVRLWVDDVQIKHIVFALVFVKKLNRRGAIAKATLCAAAPLPGTKRAICQDEASALIG